MKVRLIVSCGNPAVRDHHIHGRHLLPGLAYIDLLYQIFRKRGHDYRALELRNLSIYQPLAVERDDEVMVDVQIDEAVRGQWQITVEGRIRSNGVTSEECRRYITAEMREIEPVQFDQTIDIQELRQSRRHSIELDRFYTECRRRGLVHDEFMKAQGLVLLTDAAAYVDCSLTEPGSADAHEVLFHPALIDASATCGGGGLALLSEKAEERLVLPLFYESFVASAPINQRCIARLQKSLGRYKNDLSYFTLEFFDAQGRQVAKLNNFAGKVVRDAGFMDSAGANPPLRAPLVDVPVDIDSRPEPALQAADSAASAGAQSFLRRLIAERLNLSIDQIDPTTGYYELGVTSAVLLELVREIESKIGASLSPTLLFEYTTIAELSAYLAENHAWFGDASASLDPPKTAASGSASTAAPTKPIAGEPIAIIGMSGRFAASKNIRELWKNLKAGKSCITEIPASRWDPHLFDELQSPSGKNLSRWGGFVDDADCFDPQFFRISPREADAMDPQERLFLESCWEAMEDAGYTPKTLVTPKGPDKRRLAGVFAGLMHKDYALIGSEAQSAGAPAPFSPSNASIANRVSFFCNFHGPSMVIDTVCSSSLVAVHLALQSIHSGECEVAFAGGVNLSLHPSKYFTYGMLDMHASDGHCHSFGAGGDGYVSADGVGVVVLKPLHKAVADGDHIYAVIKGSATNHVGGVSGFMVPSPVAQADAIANCLQVSEVDARTISYVEAHGTGTSLGDPIEIDGLTKAYRRFTQDTQFCAIGSIKSNIGHAESAAGVSALIKVALQLRHRTLVPSLHSKELNPHIEWRKTPFYVQQELQPWPTTPDAGFPRRAGLSSFGATGSNVHVIVEEYGTPQEAQPAHSSTSPDQVVVTLSARNAERLREYAQALQSFIQEEPVDVTGLAYTLQVGREAFEFRVAFVVQSLSELDEQLAAFMGGGELRRGFVGHAKRSRSAAESPVISINDEQVAAWLKSIELEKLAQSWVQGASVDWNLLHRKSRPTRVSAPSYPFARERYWIPKVAKTTGPSAARNRPSEAPVTVLHPLLHANTSDLIEQRFSSKLTGEELFLSNCRTRGMRVLSGAAHLEMARAAVVLAAGPQVHSADTNVESKQRGIVSLKSVISSHPLVVSEAVNLHIALYPEESGEIGFEIYSDSRHAGGEGDVIHSTGRAALLAATEVDRIDLAATKATCHRKMSAQECHDVLINTGVAFGTNSRGLEALSFGQGTDAEPFALAELKLPASVADTQDQYDLHPSVLDSAWQAVCLFVRDRHSTLINERPDVTFELHEAQVIDRTPEHGFALIRRSIATSNGVDVELCDETGRVCLRLKGLATGAHRAEHLESSTEVLLLEQHWARQPLDGTRGGAGHTIHAQDHWILFDAGLDEHLAVIEVASARARCEILSARSHEAAERVTSYAMQLFRRVQALLQARPRSPVLVQLVLARSEEEGDLISSLAALLRSAARENPQLRYQVIEIDAAEPAEGLLAKLEANAAAANGNHIRYVAGERFVVRLAELGDAKMPSQGNLPWKDGGVYLITGGAGALGLIFAREIVSRVQNAHIVLTGRSSLSDAKLARLGELGVNGAVYEYRTLDVTDAAAVRGLVRDIVDRHGALHGVIHSAGIIQDNFVIRKTVDQLGAVLAPKVAGTVNLDLATAEVRLDFFILFSSVAGVLGNVGQADYALANAFLDRYAVNRNRLAENRRRHGRSLSINWPLWAEGGMRMEAASVEQMRLAGIHPLPDAAGLAALYRAWGSQRPQVVVLAGERRALQPLLNGDGNASASAESSGSSVAIDRSLLADTTLQRLKELFGSISRHPIDRIDADEPLENYGIDSIMITQLNKRLGEVFGEISKTLFYEYPTLASLRDHLVAACAPGCMKWCGPQPSESQREIGSGSDPSRAQGAPVSMSASAPRRTQRRTQRRSISNDSGAGSQREPIAVIGLSGRYPQARDPEAYWENLKAGKDCVTEVPAERWSLEGFHDPDVNTALEKGKSYSKWGGFVEGFAEFDPLFFNISPREALSMDPQERLFLLSCWEVLEDAGYTRELIAQRHQGRVGVFAGITKTGFNLYGPGWRARGEEVFPHTSFSSVANRVSYVLDLKGPSMPIDTMCSASLTAIHEACEHLLRRECEMAIAGGVNLYLHPSSYLMLCGQRMLSVDGQCRSFGAGASGFVPGEGVGTVLLKPLSKAIADGDRIRAVIRATSVNHGGKTHGYTVPNPNAQRELIRDALKKAQLDARSISYIEAHGTGTELGDPIEITGLTQAFGTEEKQFCALGSVKSNIGHLEAAAGIAGLTKVILQMEHRMLVPSLHARELNPNIDFSRTPFRVQQQLEPWRRPVLTMEGRREEYPRIAGISSFGAGGANAHVIVEEYATASIPVATMPSRPAIIVLSAKSEERLKEQVSRLLAAIERRSLNDDDLRSLAFTLQVGREAMECRIALTADSISSLQEKMREYLDRGLAVAGLHFGKARRNSDATALFTPDEDLHRAAEAWVEKGKYSKLLNLWVNGFSFDWNTLYRSGPRPRCMSLPTYPFAPERYWIETSEPEREVATVDRAGPIHGIEALQDTSAPAAHSEPTHDLIIFDEQWQEQSVAEGLVGPLASLQRVVCFASQTTSQEKLRTALLERAGALELIFISEGPRFQQHAAHHYSIVRSEGASYKRVFAEIEARHGQIDAVLYLWPLEDERLIAESEPIVHLLRGLSSAGQKSARVLLAGQCADAVQGSHLESWIGFERSLRHVLPEMQLAVIFEEKLTGEEGFVEARRSEALEGGVEEQGEWVQLRRWAHRLWSELQVERLESALYQGTRRHVFRVLERSVTTTDTLKGTHSDDHAAIPAQSANDGSRFIEKSRVRNIRVEASHAAPRDCPELVTLQAEGDLTPTFWFHALLGTVQIYTGLSRALGKRLPFYGVQSRSVTSAERPVDDMREMAAHYTDILTSRFDSHLPFQLGGYSGGGVVAYEVACQLQRRGRVVKNIVMLDAPYMYGTVPVNKGPEYQKILYLMVYSSILGMNSLGVLTGISDMQLRDLSAEAALSYLAHDGIRKGLRYSHEELRALIERHYEIAQANGRAVTSYKPRELIDSASVECCYFQRRSMEAFFVPTPGRSSVKEETNRFYKDKRCAENWKRHLPKLRFHATTAPDHHSLLSEEEPFEAILAACRDLYIGRSQRPSRRTEQRSSALHQL